MKPLTKKDIKILNRGKSTTGKPRHRKMLYLDGVLGAKEWFLAQLKIGIEIGYVDEDYDKMKKLLDEAFDIGDKE